MTTDLTALWRTNRRWRAWMDANTRFVTPDTLQCLRHMRNETCEAADLLMRIDHPEEVRNNGRDSTVEQELADVVVMALTVLSEPPDAREVSGWKRHPVEFDIDYLCHHANDAVNEYKENDSEFSWWIPAAYRVIEFVLAYPGLDLPAELDRCWRRLAVKHGMMALDKWLCSRGESEASISYIFYKNDTDNWWPAPWLVEER